MPATDTIAAVATAYGRAGIGVVRVSGPATQQLAVSLIGRLPRERQATLSEFRDADGDVIDRGIAILFSGPRSYTGEDVLEIQASQSLRSAEAGYAAGTLNALDLLDAERVLLDVRIAAARARADYAITLAELEGTVAAPVSAGP